MTTLTRYKCDTCGCQFNTESEALICELKHVKFSGDLECLYSHESKYPSWVEVSFEDGEKIKYTRSK